MPPPENITPSPKWDNLPPYVNLTPTEKKYLISMATGHNDEEIAAQNQVTVGAVKLSIRTGIHKLAGLDDIGDKISDNYNIHEKIGQLLIDYGYFETRQEE
jgi:hypothetical protein